MRPAPHGAKPSRPEAGARYLRGLELQLQPVTIHASWYQGLTWPHRPLIRHGVHAEATNLPGSNHWF